MTRKQTVVLIHGLSETREVWSRQVSFLQPFVDVVAYDIRGFGSSPTGSADGSVRQMADDLGQLLSALQTGPAWLVGFSMGGVIAQRFALDFAHLTRGLVLIASSCSVGRAGEKFFHQRIDQVSSGGLDALAAINNEDARGCLGPRAEHLVADYQRLRVGAVREAEGYLNACRAMLRLAEEPLAPSLGAIARPTLVVAGELDPYCPPRASEMIAAAIPGADLEVIPQAGHCMQWEASDIVNTLIRGFLEAHLLADSTEAAVVRAN